MATNRQPLGIELVKRGIVRYRKSTRISEKQS